MLPRRSPLSSAARPIDRSTDQLAWNCDTQRKRLANAAHARLMTFSEAFQGQPRHMPIHIVPAHRRRGTQRWIPHQHTSGYWCTLTSKHGECMTLLLPHPPLVQLCSVPADLYFLYIQQAYYYECLMMMMMMMMMMMAMMFMLLK